ncbi:xylose isomerase-like [Gossypium hirsutum]|uniref:xylose isomerase n=1 Tax=Gossypium hirsutum TaxID=3635 RepID=A0ABM3A0T5_GOSHI|nr:xylose isomerase-like [Gossypium hirsutum]
MERELDHMARFLEAAAAYKKKIGFNGTLLIEPKPQNLPNISMTGMLQQHLTSCVNMGCLIVPGFRFRIIPVLGTIPAIFGQVIASYVVTQLAGLDVQTEPVVLQFTVFSVLKTIAS